MYIQVLLLKYEKTVIDECRKENQLKPVYYSVYMSGYCEVGPRPTTLTNW